ncbi:MAG: AraC family transcriptional regulator [Pedobacter sp.]|nr:MAG: AraC family transcriptional regulator [Pedobacter sp.]
MYFQKIAPHQALSPFIDCYWIIETNGEEPKVEKIIPDGFTEVIFHYGSDCRTKISGTWQTQCKDLLAGQIKSYFYLENTGSAAMIAIKFKPAALTQLFGLDMSEFTDSIGNLDAIGIPELTAIRPLLIPYKDEDAAKKILDNYFLNLCKGIKEGPVNIAIDLIFKTNGIVSVNDMAEAAGIGERQLERLFKKYVGLSPKYYARIIRFNYIFQLINEGKTTWNDIVYQSGYYDQSHFIRNFKAFTGEDPSSYYFKEENMANFFLNKQ